MKTRKRGIWLKSPFWVSLLNYTRIIVLNKLAAKKVKKQKWLVEYLKNTMKVYAKEQKQVIVPSKLWISLGLWETYTYFKDERKKKIQVTAKIKRIEINWSVVIHLSKAF